MVEVFVKSAYVIESLRVVSQFLPSREIKSPSLRVVNSCRPRKEMPEFKSH